MLSEWNEEGSDGLERLSEEADRALDWIWRPLEQEAERQGADAERGRFGQGTGSVPAGWRARDPEAMGAVLEKALFAQLSMLMPGGALAARSMAARNAMSRASWGLGFASDCGCFKQAVDALGRACREMALQEDPLPLREALLRGALEPSLGSSRAQAGARLMELDGCADIWAEDSAWARARAGSVAGSSPSGELRDLCWWGAKLLKAGSERHECAVAAASLLAKFAKRRGPGQQERWLRVGAFVGARLGGLFVSAKKLPMAFFEGLLPAEFWLGAKSSLGPSSKTGAAIHARLLAMCERDEPLKGRLCANAWLGLDRKEIDAFEERFPAQAGSLLGPAVALECADSPGWVAAAYRVGKALERPSGAWARPALAAHGLFAQRAFDHLLRAGPPLLGRAMAAVYAEREALSIKDQVRRSRVAKAAEGDGKKAARLKKGASKRI